MTIDEITDKIIESKNNDIAKAFTMHITSLLINNGIVPIMTEYTRNDVKNITDVNEYKLVMEYGVAFKELDCSKHDKEIYNIAIDDFLTDIINKINFEDKWLFDCKSNNADTNIAFSALRTFVNERAEQLKAGGKNESIQM